MRCSSSLLVVLKVKEDETTTLLELDTGYVSHLSQYCISMSFNVSMVSQYAQCTCIYSRLTPISRHSCENISFNNVFLNFSCDINFKVHSSEFYFHKPITVHIELYFCYRFIHFFTVRRSVLTAENLIKVKVQQSF